MRVQAILSIHPNVTTFNGDTEVWDKDGNEVTINQALVDAEVQRLQAEYDNAQYSRDRSAAYPSIEDQLDKIYHDGIDAWKADIKAVKDEYPKP